MFETIEMAPADAILGLTVAFKADTNPKKINLGVGVYKDAAGTTPVLKAVKLAEARLLASEQSKSYLPIDGSPEYATAAQAMLFGPGHEIMANRRAVTAQTPGGTGALRVAGDFIARKFPDATVWLSDPTWPNHPNVFKASGLKVASYPYFDQASNGVAFDAMLAALSQIPAGDVVLLHGVCHNPTGVDLSPQQWTQVAEVVAQRGLLPLIDFAYQGFAAGLEEDTVGLRAIAAASPEFLVANSYSKNFGLYKERVGAMTAVAADADAAQRVISHVKKVVRVNYSNPPAHGAAVVQTVLTDAELRAAWEAELTEMRDRINHMRHLLVETLDEKGVEQDFSFIAQQRGMFSFTGLTPAQVKTLAEKYSIYIVGSGRINVAGLTEANMDYFCTAVADVLKNS